jgi:hypothetical protein
MKPLFTTRLITPQGCPCQFKVYNTSGWLWEFINENAGLTILLYNINDIGFFGTLSTTIGNNVQHGNLICQAIFELEEFYRSS